MIRIELRRFVIDFDNVIAEGPTGSLVTRFRFLRLLVREKEDPDFLISLKTKQSGNSLKSLVPLSRNSVNVTGSKRTREVVDREMLGLTLLKSRGKVVVYISWVQTYWEPLLKKRLGQFGDACVVNLRVVKSHSQKSFCRDVVELVFSLNMPLTLFKEQVYKLALVRAQPQARIGTQI